MERRLIEAAISGNETILDELIIEDPLILHRVSLTRFNETPLHIASLCGNLDFVTAILSRKPSFLTKSDSFGHCPLHLACAEGHIEIVKMLYQACPEVSERRDQDGRTPLELAALNEHVEVLNFLVQENPALAKLTKEDSQENILHLCVRYNAINALKLLVDKWSKDEVANSKDNHGNTLLHLAVIHQQIEMVKYLLAEGGFGENSSPAHNKDGFTALDVLDYCPRNLRTLKILDILLRAGIRREKSRPILPHRSSSYKKPIILIETTSVPKIIEKLQGILMILATLVAGICFQAGLNPPGGVWQDSSYDHQAGTSILAISRTWYYKVFMILNTISFMLSISTMSFSVILTRITSLSPYTITIMFALMGGAIGCMVTAYWISLSMLTPVSIHTDYGLNVTTWILFCFIASTAIGVVSYRLRLRSK